RRAHRFARARHARRGGAGGDPPRRAGDRQDRARPRDRDRSARTDLVRRRPRAPARHRRARSRAPARCGAAPARRAAPPARPDDGDIVYALFETLFHGGRPSEAMGVYRRIIKLAPKFRLALIHNFTFYISHGDSAGTAWAVGLGDFQGDAYSRLWEPRILIGR